MHVYKPDHVLLSQAYHTINRQAYVFLTVAYLYDGKDLADEVKAWPYINSFDTQEPFDNGLKKARGTFGVIGSAYAPGGEAVTQMRVVAQIGQLTKELAVFGDRYWQQNITVKPSAASPFTSMPVTLANAFGGPGSPENIYGKGWPDGTSPVGKSLPNIELISNPVLAPEDKPSVATLGVLPAASRTRSNLLGTLNTAWLHNDFPWVPGDTNPGWFDQVPPDQHIAKYWLGTESWSVSGMHPIQQQISGNLPGLRPRLLVCQADIYEASLDLDTVWLYPDSGSVLLMYRAAVATKREDGGDIAAIAVFTEKLGQPAADKADLIDQWKSAIKQDITAPVPVAMAAPVDDDASAPELAQLKDAEQRKSEIVASLESDFAEGIKQRDAILDDVTKNAAFGEKLDPSLFTKPQFAVALAGISAADIPDPKEQHTRITSEVMQELGLAKEQAEQQMRQIAKNVGVDEQELLDAAAAARRSGAEPSSLSATEFIQSVDMPADIKAGLLTSAGELDANMASLDQSMAVVREQIDGLYASLPAVYAGIGGALKSGQKINSTMVLEHIAQDPDLAGVELNGLDFSGQDLSAVVFDGAIIKNCNFANAILRETSFKSARIEASNFSGADLSHSIWQDADIKDSDYTAINASRADFTKASVTNCQFDNCDLTKADLSQANIGQSSFKYADLSAAVLQSATFWQTDASQAKLINISASDLRVDTQSKFTAADFSQSDLSQASFQHTDLTYTIFNQANICDSYIANCDFTYSNGWQMQAKNVMFKDCLINLANWSAANLMQANFDESVVQDSNFGGANLYAVQTRTAKVRNLLLEGALLDRSHLSPDFKEVSL